MSVPWIPTTVNETGCPISNRPLHEKHRESTGSDVRSPWNSAGRASPIASGIFWFNLLPPLVLTPRSRIPPTQNANDTVNQKQQQ